MIVLNIMQVASTLLPTKKIGLLKNDFPCLIASLGLPEELAALLDTWIDVLLQG